METIYRNNDFKGNMMSIKTYLSIITLNVNGLNVPIKQQRVADWIKRQDLLYVIYKRLIPNLKIHPD